MPTEERRDKNFLKYQRLARRHLDQLTEKQGKRRPRNEDLADEDDFKSSDSEGDYIRKLRKVEEDVKDTDEPMEAFNFNDEREEGVITREGVLIQDIKARINDTWLDSIEGVEPYQPPRKEVSEEETEADPIQLKDQVRRLLHPQETVAKALRRLRGLSRPNVSKKQAEDAKLSADVAGFDQLNAACSALLGLGFAEVYEWSSADLDN
jgi:hypothetical protein